MFKILRILAILGNILFILWITYNGIDEGFKATAAQRVSYISLILLLCVNIALVYRRQ